MRWATKNQLEDPDRTRKALRFLAHGHDKFVHGSRLATMELYNGLTHRFMMKGHEFDVLRRSYKWNVASKLLQVLTALCCTASLMQMSALVEDIRNAARELYDSGELNPQPDEGTISY